MNIYQKAKEDYENSEITITELAKKYGCHRKTMSENLKKLGVDVKKQRRSYEIVCKLEKARVLHKEGMTIKELSKEFGITVKSISTYIKEKDGVILTDLCTRVPRELLKCNQNFFELLNTEDKAYWLGFIMADGCVRNSPSYTLTIELSNIDITHLKKFRKSIDSTHPIRGRKNRDMCSIAINSKKIVSDLSKYGCIQDKTNHGYISNEIFALSKELKVAYLRGYLDGDGYIDKTRNRIIYTIKSEEIAYSIMTLLKETTDIDFKIKKDNIFFRVYVENKESYIRVLKTLYGNATVFLNRKYDIYINKIMPSQDESLKMMSAELNGELLDDLYEPNGLILC